MPSVRDPYTTLASLGRRTNSGLRLSALAGNDNDPKYTKKASRRAAFNRKRTARIGSLFRSENMILVRLYFDRAAAFDTIDELGELGLCQFKDLNENQSAFQRSFSDNVRRCDEMQRVIRYLVDQINEVPQLSIAPSAFSGPGTGPSFRLDDLDAHLNSLEKTLLEMDANADYIATEYNETKELLCVLERAAEFFRAAPLIQTSSSISSSSTRRLGSAGGSSLAAGVFGELSALSETPSIVVEDGSMSVMSPSVFISETQGLQQSALLSFFTGTINREKIASFERVLFRATHGNCIVRFADVHEKLADPQTKLKMDKSVFMVFFSGSAVRTKVSKICAAFEANIYSIPDDHENQMKALSHCHTKLSDLVKVMDTTASQKAEILRDVAQQVLSWREKVRRDMGVFHTLNLLNYDTSQQLFIADVWCPESAQDDVRNALEIGRRRSNAQVPSILEERPHASDDVPPTYYKTNKFTEVFQGIVESYGVAKYQEINPAPYTIITFPFLFAVMFGDIGHGILMALFAAYMVRNEVRLQRMGKRMGEIMRAAFDGRYIILLMGIFSIYTGFIYNEMFAVPIDIFGSRWKYTSESQMACGIDNCDDPASVLPPINPYPFGFDPVWKASKTGLLFFNSYKMKLSIVLGVTQMILGICLSYRNAKFFKQKLDVLHVFIPQMIFMTAIFGYLVFIIILKWLIDYNAPSCAADPMCEPPDLKSVLIGMFMNPGNLPANMTMFPGQNAVQMVLATAAIIAVPWMLFPKPLILRAQHRRRKGYTRVGSGDDDEFIEDNLRGPAFDFGEVFVHQMIHTIEFVLGAISNTASYLRLWALSLAHAELSNVFLEKLLYMSIASGNPIAMMAGFFMWIAATIGVLMFMESLSAFLHALRLHWVEFQNKFYLLHGDGVKFNPYTHAASLEQD
ncbi:V-type proton ATPase subunit a3 [Gracilariopsis chorda]|uniref:V-type proton ATPase subunit a n=1 Tax=Gracilariopsis chorda TaxID=448386 RepID=A0A2V3J0G1_9FLOR|nr:V-type proton ATPase subunit a3 [Gracilariopsis chorda]|eukprot:PXF47868.1 V-type proton ATPase subunit a3 [Gracilariopsis chorda]